MKIDINYSENPNSQIEKLCDLAQDRTGWRCKVQHAVIH